MSTTTQKMGKSEVSANSKSHDNAIAETEGNAVLDAEDRLMLGLGSSFAVPNNEKEEGNVPLPFLADPRGIDRINSAAPQITIGMKGELYWPDTSEWFPIAISGVAPPSNGTDPIYYSVNYLGKHRGTSQDMVLEEDLRCLRHPGGAEAHNGMVTKCRAVDDNNDKKVADPTSRPYTFAKITSFRAPGTIQVQFRGNTEKVDVSVKDLLFLNTLPEVKQETDDDEAEDKNNIWKVETDDEEHFSNEGSACSRESKRNKKQKIADNDPDADNENLRGHTHVKMEIVKSIKAMASKSEILEKRKERQMLRLKACTTTNGDLRKVFRRGCNARTITQILGGTPMEPAPIVMNDPTLLPFSENPFIEQGQIYFAGNREWNPWTPSFPGDVGFIEKWCLDNLGKGQVNFHMFLHCSTKRHETNYYGPNTRGGRLYLGRYRRVPEDDASDVTLVEQTVKYADLGSASQWTIAEAYRRYERQIKGANGKVASSHRAESFYEKAKAEVEDDRRGSWEDISAEKKDIYAWVHMLIDCEHYMTIVPVEFVDYNEALYEKFVEIDAVMGEVSLDDVYQE